MTTFREQGFALIEAGLILFVQTMRSLPTIIKSGYYLGYDSRPTSRFARSRESRVTLPPVSLSYAICDRSIEL